MPPKAISLKEIILYLVQIAIFFAFPTIWAWLIKVIPGWPFGQQDTFNILIFLAITIVSWILGWLGIKRFLKQLKTRGFAADVKA